MSPKWGFQGSIGNASGGRTVLCWAHGASKMANLGTFLLPCIFQSFRASARSIVSCRNLCASFLCPKSHLCPLPCLGLSEFIDDGQNTHLVRVRLNILLYDNYLGFWLSCFSSLFHSCNYIYFWTFPVQSPEATSQNIRKRHTTLRLAAPQLDA